MGRASLVAGVALIAIAGGVALLAALFGLAPPRRTPDMARSHALLPQAQAAPLPPPDSRALGHPRRLDLFDAEEQLANPRPASTAVLEEGASLFGTYCAVCHGANGRSAIGTVGRHFRAVPDLSDPAIQEYADGVLYTIVREGGFNMPGYAEALDASERWALVHFVRSLRRP